MSEFERPHTGLTNCTCIECDLIRCGAIDAAWDGWWRVWLAGEARETMMWLTRQPPVRWCGPKTRWAGVVDWFRVMGEPLDFEAYEADEGDDASAW